jgi:N6-adenosine-specific RNA methylase IME4
VSRERADLEGRPCALRRPERERLAKLEAIIDDGLDRFVAVAAALLEIRDRRLYRATHTTFESYVRERFQLARRTCYGYLEAAAVAANVPPEAQLTLSHLRALAPLPAPAQRELAEVISPLTVAEARRVIKEWRRQQRLRLADRPPPPPIPIGAFRTIVADPPWAFDGNDRGDGLAADHYRTLPTEEIAGLPVVTRAAPDSHLYLWAPVTKIPDALRVCEAWGFRYVSLLTWVKPGLGLGQYWRISTEHVVFGVRGRLATRPNHRNWFEAKRSRHSAKPPVFHDLVSSASPGPYLELFGRRARDGWTVWGDEVAA